MYQINNLTKIYRTDEIEKKALDNVTLAIEDGKFIAILGASGSGKSTLLNMLGGLDEPTEGEIILNGVRFSGLNDTALATYRRQKIGFVFQSFNLIPVLSVYENVVMPVVLDKKPENRAYIEELLQYLNIFDKINAFPSQLSGGQQQRVAIARAFANKPEIILADEPTGNLDSKAGEEVVNLLLDMQKKYNQTVIMITHNEHLAQKADQIIYMKDGRVE